MFICSWENSHFLCIKHTEIPQKIDVFPEAVRHVDIEGSCQSQHDRGVSDLSDEVGLVPVACVFMEPDHVHVKRAVTGRKRVRVCLSRLM